MLGDASARLQVETFGCLSLCVYVCVCVMLVFLCVVRVVIVSCPSANRLSFLKHTPPPEASASRCLEPLHTLDTQRVGGFLSKP